MFFKKNRIEHDEAGYYDAVSLSDLIENQITSISINGEKIIIVRLVDQIRAFSAHCPHASGNLTIGTYYRERIDCPEHEYRFDVRTGKVIWPEDELCHLRFFDVLVEEGRVKVRF